MKENAIATGNKQLIKNMNAYNELQHQLAKVLNLKKKLNSIFYSMLRATV